LGLSQKVLSDKNNIPSSGSYAGAGGHGTVVFAVVTTVPCSDSKVSKNLKSLSERWNVVTTRYFETASTIINNSDYAQPIKGIIGYCI